MKLRKDTLEYIEKTKEEFLNTIRKPVSKKDAEKENSLNGVYCGKVIKTEEK